LQLCGVPSTESWKSMETSRPGQGVDPRRNSKGRSLVRKALVAHLRGETQTGRRAQGQLSQVAVRLPEKGRNLERRKRRRELYTQYRGEKTRSPPRKLTILAIHPPTGEGGMPLAEARALATEEDVPAVVEDGEGWRGGLPLENATIAGKKGIL
jgi:hypothetical protein